MIANILYYLIMGYTYMMHYFNKVVSFLKSQQKIDKLELIIDNNSQEIYKNELVIIAPIQFNFIQYTTPDSNISIYFTASIIIVPFIFYIYVYCEICIKNILCI